MTFFDRWFFRSCVSNIFNTFLCFFLPFFFLVARCFSRFVISLQSFSAHSCPIYSALYSLLSSPSFPTRFLRDLRWFLVNASHHSTDFSFTTCSVVRMFLSNAILGPFGDSLVLASSSSTCLILNLRERERDRTRSTDFYSGLNSTNASCLSFSRSDPIL